MITEKWKIVAIAVFSLILTTIFFWGVKPGEFLFLHDEMLVINYGEALNGLFVRGYNDLSVDNTISLTVTLLDRLYYFLGFSLGISLQFLQKFFYFIKIFLSLLLPYIGFRKFAEAGLNKNKEKTSDYIIWLITFLYAFNTYTTIFWHANAFQFSLVLCYALAPLALFYFDEIINSPNPKLKLLIKEALALLLMSFSVYFFATFIFVILTFYIVNLFINPKILRTSFISLIKLAIISVPLYLFFIPIALIVVYGVDTVNSVGGGTFSSLSGGILYPLFLWFTWGIYTDWAPKNVFTFSQYYRGILYLLSPLVIFITIFWGLRRGATHKNIIIFLAIFLVLLVLVKGSQPPFQEIYVQLITYFPPFRVFRSPDNKFGFGIILSLCFLLLYVSKNLRKEVYLGAMTFVILVQAAPLVSGIAIKGQNTDTSSDRIISIPQNYEELANYLNTNSDGTEYILPIPTNNFGHFIMPPTEKHLGQDLVPKLVKNPFITPDEYSAMSNLAYRKISESIENNLEGIDDFPVGFFLIRRDLEFIARSTNIDITNNPKVEKVFSNEIFDLYKNNSAAKIVEAENVKNMTFNVVSPTEYKVSLNGINDSAILVLNNSFNKNWKVYIDRPSEDKKTHKFSFYPNQNSIELDTANIIHSGFSNEWVILKENLPDGFYKTNDDGTMDVQLTIFYYPQTMFYIYGLITATTVLIYATFIFVKKDE